MTSSRRSSGPAFAVLLIASVHLHACSGGGGARSPDAGGGSGVGGTGASGGAGGGDAGTPAGNPLCPASGPIVQGPTPLPDGVQIVGDLSGSTVGVYRVAVGGGFAYWVTDTAIHRVPVTGGAATTVLDRASARNHMGSLAVDGATLYFTESGIYNPLGVAKMPGDGSAAPTTLVGGGGQGRILLSGGYVYYYDANVGALARVAVAGGPPTMLVTGVDPADLMAVANGYLYFIDPRSNSFDVHLFRVRIDAQAPSADAGAVDGGGGAEIVAVTDNYNTDGVAADATNLYWDQANRVMTMPQAGGTPRALDELPDQPGTLGLTETTYVGSVAVAGGKLYWNALLGCGDIMRAATDGTQKSVLVHAPLASYGLTIDGDYLYFIAAGRQLLRAPR